MDSIEAAMVFCWSGTGLAPYTGCGEVIYETGLAPVTITAPTTGTGVIGWDEDTRLDGLFDLTKLKRQSSPSPLLRYLRHERRVSP
jgi:hypothetical protein